MCRDLLSLDKVFLCGVAYEVSFPSTRTREASNGHSPHKPPLYRLIFSPVMRYVSVSVAWKSGTFTPRTQGTPSRDIGSQRHKFVQVNRTRKRRFSRRQRNVERVRLACATHPQGNAIVTLSSPNICKLFTYAHLPYSLLHVYVTGVMKNCF